MTKPIQPKSFENRMSFPGENGNIFDVFVHLLEIINAISVPLFLLLLFGLALLIFQDDWGKVFILSGFFVTDWIILRLLPIFKRSFGPANSACMMLAILRLPFTLLPFQICMIAQFIGSILMIYGFWFEPQRLQLVHQILKTNKIPVGAKVSILHVSDLHLEELTQREIKLQTILEETHPNIIIFTGDILNLSHTENEQTLLSAFTYIDTWHAPHGIFMVPGSPAVDTPKILENAVQQFPDRYLINTCKVIHVNGIPIRLIGLGCSHRPHIDFPTFKSLTTVQPVDLNILLYHSPDLAPLIDGNVDLYLCGHTHGGQVRLPFIGALFTGSLYGRKLQAGKYQFGKTILYISRGMGMEGAGAPRVRFLCRPEVTLWEICGTNDEENNND